MAMAARVAKGSPEYALIMMGVEALDSVSGELKVGRVRAGTGERSVIPIAHQSRSAFVLYGFCNALWVWTYSGCRPICSRLGGSMRKSLEGN